MRKLLYAFCLLIVLAGCTPRTVVRPNPGPQDTGIRYYRPKPYLLLQPCPVAENAEVRKDKHVQISLEYLPDFSEEYSITVRTGLGTNHTNITLKDGWNLTQIDQNMDSNFDENVEAISNLLKSAGSIVKTDAKDGVGPRLVVEAANVPLGYYESVISRGCDGKKRLYGWRYVGFLPFHACPLDANGGDFVDCHSSLLYGLVFHDGIMKFEPLHETGQRSVKDVREVRVSALVPLPLVKGTLNQIAAQETQAIRTQLRPTRPFDVQVQESRPHVVFTIVTDDAEGMHELLANYTEDLTETLHRIVYENTGMTYTPIIRVAKNREGLPAPEASFRIP